jgi:RHS repeat-associated protein
VGSAGSVLRRENRPWAPCSRPYGLARCDETGGSALIAVLAGTRNQDSTFDIHPRGKASTFDGQHRRKCRCSGGEDGGSVDPLPSGKGRLGLYCRPAMRCTIGAMEYTADDRTARDDGGRTVRRVLAGGARVLTYGYDSRGRLERFTDSADPSCDATYRYDGAVRRIGMAVGGVRTYRFVYDPAGNGSEAGLREKDGVLVSGDDVVAEYVDTDQVGSVVAVADEAGRIVNRYVYDAFGNLDERLSFETVENRYRFQGREYDAHRGEYYWRARNYVPEWGMFSGPDMNLERAVRGETEGVGNYVFCRNSPTRKTDPLGLTIEFLEPDLRGYAKDVHDAVKRHARDLERSVRETIAGRAGSVMLQGILHCLDESKDVTVTIQIRNLKGPMGRTYGTFQCKEGKTIGYPFPPIVPVGIHDPVDPLHALIHEIVHVLELLVVKDKERVNRCECLGDAQVMELLEGLKRLRNSAPHAFGAADTPVYGIRPAEFLAEILLGRRELPLTKEGLKTYASQPLPPLSSP